MQVDDDSLHSGEYDYAFWMETDAFPVPYVLRNRLDLVQIRSSASLMLHNSTVEFYTNLFSGAGATRLDGPAAGGDRCAAWFLAEGSGAGKPSPGLSIAGMFY